MIQDTNMNMQFKNLTPGQKVAATILAIEGVAASMTGWAIANGIDGSIAGVKWAKKKLTEKPDVNIDPNVHEAKPVK